MGIRNRQIQSQATTSSNAFRAEPILDLELILKGGLGLALGGSVILLFLASFFPTDSFFEIFKFDFIGYILLLLTMIGVSIGLWYSLSIYQQGFKERSIEVASAFFYLPFFAAVFLELLHFNDSRLYFAVVFFVFSSLFLYVKILNQQTFYILLLFGLAFVLDSIGTGGHDHDHGHIAASPESTDLLILFFAIMLLNGVLRTIITYFHKHSEALLSERQKNIDYQVELENIVNERTLDLIKEKNIAIQESMAKSQFLANMSHELRTPLNAIIGYTELIQEEIIAENITEVPILEPDIGRIGDAGRNLLQLINNVLDFSKIEANQTTINIAQIDIPEVVYDAISLINPLLTKSGNEIRISPIDERLRAYGDTQKVKQVLINLLGNANKFTYKGSIILTVESQEDHVVISVADTGIGIKPEFLHQLFKPFSQVQNEFDRQFEGTGLGLAISKRFMELMNGDIQVQSVYGQGTIFSVFIPSIPPNQQLKKVDIRTEGFQPI